MPVLVLITRIIYRFTLRFAVGKLDTYFIKGTLGKNFFVFTIHIHTLITILKQLLTPLKVLHYFF